MKWEVRTSDGQSVGEPMSRKEAVEHAMKLVGGDAVVSPPDWQSDEGNVVVGYGVSDEQWAATGGDDPHNQPKLAYRIQPVA